MKIEIKIDEILEKLGKSKYWLSKQADYTYPSLDNFIKGRVKSVNLEKLENMCRALNCTPNHIFGFKEFTPEDKSPE